MPCDCAQFEILLCDAVDGTLRGEAERHFQSHRANCPACAELAADVLSATTFMERVAAVDPPRELLTRILFETTGRKAANPHALGWWSTLRNWASPALQPRLAMGMAMTILSLSMLAQVFGIQLRQLRASDLEPAGIWAGVEDSSHRSWSRVVKYYENIRVVYEIQSRLKEWADQEEQDRQGQARDTAGQPRTIPAPDKPADSPAQGQ